MKKILVFIVMMICSQTSFAIDFNTMAEKVKSIKGVMVMDINGKTLKEMAQSNGNKYSSLADSIEKGVIIVCDGSSKKDKKKFDCILQEFDAEGYEDLINIEENKEGVRISIKRGNDYINELLIIVRDEDESLVLHANGKFKSEDISKMKNGIKLKND